jgi:hypothetical protein
VSFFDRKRVTLFACLASLAACTVDDPAAVVMPRDIRILVTASAAGSIRAFQELMAEQVNGLVLFRVDYGRQRCSSCSYTSAFGLKFRGRIGWLLPPEGTTLASTRFDLLASDGYLMDRAFLHRVRAADADAYGAIRLWITQDRDASHTVLAFIAASINDHGADPQLGMALLDQPFVQSSRSILELLTRAGISSTWNDVRARAWSLLAPKIPAVADLAFTAGITQTASGAFNGMLTIGNATPKGALLEYAGICTPTLLLFSQPIYTVSPSWDALRRRNVPACKSVPLQISIDPQASGRLVTWAATATDVLGDSLPNGTYYAAVRVHIWRPSSNTLVIPAGALLLAR